ncbi:MAG TPA: DUF2231 domain-containing protein [Gemmatimonadales bacterium]|nr:DUF2231 domain-containing protein [Gemmatimonadales bacterium]
MLGYDAPRWHALLNDFPAALLVVAVLFDLAAAVGKRESLKWAGAWTLWAGVLGGWAAVVAGELAEKAIEHGEAIHELMEQHERRALVTMGIFTVILAWKLYRRFALPSMEEWVTRILSIIGVVGICYVGSAGGKLAFEHAAGVPTKTLEAEVQNREAGHEHEPGEADEHERAAPADTAKGAHVDPPGTPPHKH